MDGGWVVGIAGALAALIGGIAAWRKGGTEGWAALLQAQTGHMEGLREDYVSERTQRVALEERVLLLEKHSRKQDEVLSSTQLDLARCEGDKTELRRAVETLQREVRGG